MDKVKAAKRIGRGVGIGAAAALVVALGLGAYTVFSGAGSKVDVASTSYTGPVVESVAPPAQDMTAAQSLYDQQIAAAAAAQAQAQATAAAQAKSAAVSTTPVPTQTTAPAPIRCPAGSQANSGDAGNDTSCFPVICFHIILPDPAHPECVTPFKP